MVLIIFLVADKVTQGRTLCKRSLFKGRVLTIILISRLRIVLTRTIHSHHLIVPIDVVRCFIFPIFICYHVPTKTAFARYY